jgi:hypothetical protein
MDALDVAPLGTALRSATINYLRAKVATVEYQTVRGVFPEGEPAYDGAMIMSETHVQVAVLDKGLHLGVFRPTHVK